MILIYICHPLRGDVAANQARVAEIARRLAEMQNVAVFAPHLHYPSILEDDGVALRMCVDMVNRVDILYVAHDPPSAGMLLEIEAARGAGVRIERSIPSSENPIPPI